LDFGASPLSTQH